MTQYIKGKNGKFAGSIGDGKTNIPTPAPVTVNRSGTCHQCESPEDTLSDEGLCAGCFDTQEENGYAQAWERYLASKVTTELLPCGPFHETRARLALTMGECHNLALAVHRKTGWPLIAFSPWNEDGPGTTGTLVHVGVLTPDGYVLDGHGANIQSWSEDQGEYEGVLLTGEEELTSWISSDVALGQGSWLPLRPEAFDGYLPAVLQAYQAAKQ